MKEDEARRRVSQKELEKVRKQHTDEMNEYSSFVETSTKSDGGDGAEESKGDEKRSPVLQELKDFTSEQLEEILEMAASSLTASSSNSRVAKGRSKKARAKTQEEEAEEDEHSEEESAREDEASGMASSHREGVQGLKRQINLMEADRDRLKGSINMTSLVEYRKKDEEFRGRLAELEEITTKRNAARKEYEDLRRKRLEEFMAGFGTITLKLKEMYQMITLGGDAELELDDSLDPFSEWIVFSVRPHKKSWKNISNLSGGEKTLSSLALVFALHHFKPTPLYVMDEIDAALDFKNVSIVAIYIKDRTKNAQFVIISLRNNMFELANRLVGIYKTHDSTKSVTINPHAFDAALKPSVTSAAPRMEEEGPRKKSARTHTTKLASSVDDSAISAKMGSKTVLGDSTNLRA